MVDPLCVLGQQCACAYCLPCKHVCHHGAAMASSRCAFPTDRHQQDGRLSPMPYAPMPYVPMPYAVYTVCLWPCVLHTQEGSNAGSGSSSSSQCVGDTTGDRYQPPTTDGSHVVQKLLCCPACLVVEFTKDPPKRPQHARSQRTNVKETDSNKYMQFLRCMQSLCARASSSAVAAGVHRAR